MNTEKVGIALTGWGLALAMVSQAVAGSISGTVTFKGNPRPPKSIKMSADPVCAAAHGDAVKDEKFVVGEGEGDVYPLADIFVYVKSGAPEKEYPVPSKPVAVDQKGCTFIPHVVGVQVGQELTFKNSDKTMHNVHALSQASPAFNRGMPAGAPDVTYKFTAPEVMAKFKCDAHPWMSLYVGVMDHPFFAVTGKDGKFTLGELPDGEYEVEVWQELLKTQSSKVTVRNGAGTVDFQYERTKK